jgi:phosphoglycerate dehydrogenase-like enzyme
MTNAVRIFAAIACMCTSLQANADVDINDLIQEAGLRAGPVAMRDMPGWRSPQKVVFMGTGELDVELPLIARQVQFVKVNSMQELLAEAPNADGIIGACNAAVIDAATRLMWVQQYGTGAERCLSVPAVGSGRVVMTNMQKMSSPVIAEHAIAMTLSLGRGLTYFAKTMEEGAWERRPASVNFSSVIGKTMLVVGLGGIGTETARRAAALGMTVYATRNSSREGPDFVEYVGLSDELLELAGKADVIVNALPLTPSTTALFDREFFDSAKRGALFVSVGRGASTVTDDLVAALQSGRIGGAGLDVTDPEPLPADHPLWQMSNVIITPHISGRASQIERHQAVAQENLRRFLNGDALLNVVDPKRGY